MNKLNKIDFFFVISSQVPIEVKAGLGNGGASSEQSN